jgi:hypothetical protein
MALALVLVLSSAFAAIVVRVPALWRMVPAWLVDGVSRAMYVTSQETSAVAEYVAAWAVSFACTSVAAVLAFVFTPRK